MRVDHLFELRPERIVARIAEDQGTEGAPYAAFLGAGAVRFQAGAGATVAVGHGDRSVLADQIGVMKAQGGERIGLDTLHRLGLPVFAMVIA